MHRAVVRRRFDVHPPRDEQVVVERDDGEDGAEEDQAVHPAIDRREEHVELGPEAGDERDAAERQQEDQHREREQRRPLREAAVGVDVVRLLRPRHGFDDEERAHVPEQVRHEIEEHHRDAAARQRREADQHVADVRDARVGEQALDVVLRDRHQVAGDDRHAGDRGERRASRRATRRPTPSTYSRMIATKPAALGATDEPRDKRRAGGLVRIGRPHVERERPRS